MKERITILGAGESGTGAAILASRKGFEVFVTDSGKIQDKYKKELSREGIAFEEGGHSEDQVLACSMIIKSPGIPHTASLVRKAVEKSIPIIDEIEFAFRYMTGKVIAITGTNGKTTTTLLTYHLMKTAGFNTCLGGNVGKSLARQVADGSYEWYVIEVSSFQLEGIDTFKPSVGVLLNITPDHLDRYQYSMSLYADAKFNMTRNMTANDHFVYFADDAIVSGEVSRRPIEAQKIGVSLKDITPVYFDGERMHLSWRSPFSVLPGETSLVGQHNIVNMMCAATAVLIAGGTEQSVREGLKTFKNAPHRLESVASINGIEYVNDSKATNVDAVAYALGSFTSPLVWIAGGVDKGNDYQSIKVLVKEKVKALICLGKDNEKLKAAFADVVNVVRETQEVKELVRMAMEMAESGDVVLLSPACASFDLFRNYEDRGNQFREAVLDLKKEIEESAG